MRLTQYYCDWLHFFVPVGAIMQHAHYPSPGSQSACVYYVKKLILIARGKRSAKLTQKTAQSNCTQPCTIYAQSQNKSACQSCWIKLSLVSIIFDSRPAANRSLKFGSEHIAYSTTGRVVFPTDQGHEMFYELCRTWDLPAERQPSSLEPRSDPLCTRLDRSKTIKYQYTPWG